MDAERKQFAAQQPKGFVFQVGSSANFGLDHGFFSGQKRGVTPRIKRPQLSLVSRGDAVNVASQERGAERASLDGMAPVRPDRGK